MPCPQADTLMNLESATFSYSRSFRFVQFQQPRNNNNNNNKTLGPEAKMSPNQGKNGASLSLHTIG